MKKTYLEPKSETLMAILTEVCGDPNPTLEPGTLASSATPHSAPRVGNGIPMSRGL